MFTAAITYRKPIIQLPVQLMGIGFFLTSKTSKATGAYLAICPSVLKAIESYLSTEQTQQQPFSTSWSSNHLDVPDRRLHHPFSHFHSIKGQTLQTLFLPKQMRFTCKKLLSYMYINSVVCIKKKQCLLCAECVHQQYKLSSIVDCRSHIQCSEHFYILYE